MRKIYAVVIVVMLIFNQVVFQQQGHFVYANEPIADVIPPTKPINTLNTSSNI